MHQAFKAALLIAALTFSVPAHAAEEPIVQEITEAEAAGLLMQAGRIDDAKLVLANVLAREPQNNDALFLSGLIAIGEQDYDIAIAHFRKILTREPDAERVRLELARAFFLAGDYDNAARNFRFARAGDLPPEAATNVDQYLGAIQRLKRWSYHVSLALAQDTNINAATDLNEIEIFGLPFVLSDDARRTSGYGLTLTAGGEWTPPLGDTWKARLGLNFQRSEYGGNDFDDMTVSAHAGPEILRPRWQAALLATGYQRWFANVPYNNGAGTRVIANYVLMPRLTLGTSFDAQGAWYRTQPDQNGLILSANFRINYTLSPSSTVHLAGGLGARDAEIDAYSSSTKWIGAGFYRDLPWGFSFYIEPNATFIRYHAPLAGFGETRRDRVLSVRTEILNRRIDYAGFTPKFSFVYADQKSTIPLYDYDRSQFSVALTRQF